MDQYKLELKEERVDVYQDENKSVTEQQDPSLSEKHRSSSEIKEEQQDPSLTEQYRDEEPSSPSASPPTTKRKRVSLEDSSPAAKQSWKQEAKTLRNPWRNVSWGERARALQFVKVYQPENEDVKHLRVLLYGPVGVGKSSFISSVSSTLRGRIATPALANANNKEQSFTKKYKTHKISKGGRGNYYSIVFNDIMGLEEGSGNGVSVEDMTLALKGHVKDGYKFNPVSPLSCNDPGFNPSPSPDDRVHILVWVGSANTSAVSDSVLEKMRAIREAASNLGIPQLALATKVDEACGETENDLKMIYRSKHLKRKFSTTLGIPLNCILPLKNYSQELEVDGDTDCLILSALKMMIDLGNYFINEM